jgi:hypothetical protein
MTGTITRGKVIRADLANWDGKTATHSRIDATGGTVTGLAIGNEVDVLQVFGSGSNRTRGTLAAAVQHIGSTSVVLALAPGVWTIDAALTIPSNFTLYLPRGCVLTPSSGVTLTINGPIVAGDYQIFNLANGSLAGLSESRALWFGILADNSTDNSTVMTAICGITGHRIYWPTGTIKTSNFSVPSNSQWFLKPGTIFKDTGALGASVRLMNIESVSNVHIVGYGAKVQMTRADYVTGEQRHGVNIRTATNVTIEGLESSDCGGDGFYVGGDTSTPSTDILLLKCTADNNRRNNISITNGRRVWVVYPTVTDANGTSPQKGVDIEPNSDGAGAIEGELDGIYIIGGYSSGNAGPGFSYAGGWLTASGKEISVHFIDCVSVGDVNNFQIEAAPSGIDGSIVFRNCHGYNATNNGFECKRSGMNCLVDGMWIYNANQAAGSTERTSSSYSVYSANNTDGSTYGNIRIRDSYAFGTSITKTFAQQLVNEATSVLNNVDAEIHTDATATKRAYYGLTSSQITGKNRIKFTDETELDTTSNLGTSGLVPYLNNIISNEGASGAITLTMDSATTRLPGVRLTARVKTAQSFVLNAVSTWTIGGGVALRSNTVGSQVTVESDGTGKWRIVEGGEGWHPDPIALDNSGTPSVGNGTIFETGGTTTITAFDDGVEGQKIIVLCKHALTIDCTGTTLTGNAGSDISAASGDWLEAVNDGTNWRISFHDCTA